MSAGNQEKYLYLFLNDDNEFPSWFILDKDHPGTVKVPISKKKMSRDDSFVPVSSYSFSNGKGKYEFAGEDENYKFYLKSIIVSEKSVNESHIIILKLKCEVKDKTMKDHLKSLDMAFDILAPIIN